MLFGTVNQSELEMSNNTTPSSTIEYMPRTAFEIATAVVIAVLSPAAVAGNALILAAVWKKTFQRTPFHMLLSGLAFTDLCTGLIAQPFFAASTLIYGASPRVLYSMPKLLTTMETIADCSAIFFINITVLLITLMSFERWLHMSRRSLVTSRRGCFTVMFLLLIPIPIVVCRVLADENKANERSIYIMTMTVMFFSYLSTSFACFKVYQLIRRHQQQVQANGTSQNFGRPVIDLAKYKKSVASILYIVLLFSFCFIPFIVSSGVYVSVPLTSETFVAIRLSIVLLFLSSSLNPALFVWRMNDIRSGVKQLFCRDS